jgi:K+-sensing histidine kinase KdpD
LALYRIENKQYSINIDYHNVYDFLEEAMFENKTQLAHHNIEIEIQCDRGLDWYFDRALTLGIVNTIINNALRYANNKIILVANSNDTEITISILDDGPGYPDKILNRDKDEQSDLNFNSGNTGLGFHFAKVVAEMHIKGEQHGRIELCNDGIHGGSKFSIYLP